MRRFTKIFISRAIVALAYIAAPIGGAGADKIGASETSVMQIGRFPVKSAGLYTQFERRGWASGYWSGEVIQNWNSFDPIVGGTVAHEVSLQLDTIKAFGVNTITFEAAHGRPDVHGKFHTARLQRASSAGSTIPAPNCSRACKPATVLRPHPRKTDEGVVTFGEYPYGAAATNQFRDMDSCHSSGHRSSSCTRPRAF